MSRYDLIVVGSGFASTFFLEPYLKRAPTNARVLVLERGRRDSHSWQLRHKRTASTDAASTFVNPNPEKEWVYNPGFGGGSNCWWACTPRMMPNDFKLFSQYGVGVDWPMTYEELEEFYCQVETAMSVSGPDHAPYPRSRPYPQPPHLFSDPDRILKAAYPDLYFQQPTARTRQPTAGRTRCCANGVCTLCPVDAKFTIGNEMGHIYRDPRVELQLESTVLSVETAAGKGTGVRYTNKGIEIEANGDLIALGANGLFNPYLLQRSELHHPLLGKYLNEQVSVYVWVDLDGVDNFQGSTSITGHGYMLYDGEHRAHRAACLIESFNVPNVRALRPERGKWRRRLQLKFIFEHLPDSKNHVKPNPQRTDLPETVYLGHSDYARRGIEHLPTVLPKLLAPLPVERWEIGHTNRTEAHIVGTVVMGADPQHSIVDPHLVHHQIRNLVMLGSCVFPTCPPANPTLTLSALSLWAAHHLFT